LDQQLAGSDQPSENGVVGPVEGTVVPRYAGLSTFARLPRLADVGSYDVAVVGVPFDSGVSYRPGARFGPSAIREASRLLKPFNPALGVEPFAVHQVVDAGDIAVNPFVIGTAIEEIDAGISALVDGLKPIVVFGGDHTVSLPILRALHRLYGKVALVHFDAHLDTWPTYFGAEYTHGTPFRRASEEGLFDDDHSAHVGIRGPLYGVRDLDEDAALGFRVWSALDVDRLGVGVVLEQLKEQVGQLPVYISIDVDVLDPAFAPGTGTPEVGGLSSRELLHLVRGFKFSHVVGLDVVEVAPAYDNAGITALVASTLGFEALSLFALRPDS
jgi:agmatinase